MASEAPVPMTPNAFQAASGVSRETLERLEVYLALLRKWQRRINLVSRNSLADPWRRHILDSAQIYHFRPEIRGLWLDLGSGAGFPALVLAIMGLGEANLVESDGRKCAFLSEAARITEAPVTIHNARIESLGLGKAQTITARALAPLVKLLDLAAPFIAPTSELLLWKGQDVDEELTRAAKYWNIRVEKHSSITDATGTILSLRELTRVQTDVRDLEE